MTKEEMNEYLESICGLENGYYTERPPITKCGFFGVDSGWYPLIKELIEDLIKLGWNKQVCQVKEKFGGLRFYINEGSNEIYERIVKAEKDSYEICETCGENGNMRTDIGWCRTLCNKHYEERKSNL